MVPCRPNPIPLGVSPAHLHTAAVWAHCLPYPARRSLLFFPHFFPQQGLFDFRFVIRFLRMFGRQLVSPPFTPSPPEVCSLVHCKSPPARTSASFCPQHFRLADVFSPFSCYDAHLPYRSLEVLVPDKGNNHLPFLLPPA